MLRVLKREQAEILQMLSNKYLMNTDENKESVEIETITELAIVFWHYKRQEEGVKITMPWFEFAISVLAPVMFKPQQFKFNGIVGKCIIRPKNEREDLLQHFKEYDTWMENKLIRKVKDAANKKKKPQEVPEA